MKNLLLGSVALASFLMMGVQGAKADGLETLHVKAPELKGVNQWINSHPLSLASLRGQVVVLHFWTFGCINCKHNYPAYRNWEKGFAGKGVTIIGVHTPEASFEHNVGAVRSMARERGLGFPIAVDNNYSVWNAWGNHYWPCIYLVDKHGIVRYRWVGELGFDGANGDQIMRQKIEQLRAERA